jgi:hypothetical protein
MSWTAYYQADGEMRHTITTTKFKWTAEHEAEEFRKRMTNPDAQLHWIWVEGDDETTDEENNEKHITEQKPNVEEVVDILKSVAGPYLGSGLHGPFSF